tara:strand:+ start:161 stop:691 length:531 start_codon:yes stop_codon:yes gene_type:complete
MNFDLSQYSSNLYTSTFLIDRALKILTEAEVGIISLINRFSELSQTTNSIESNAIKRKILDYLNKTKNENRTLFNTNWSWNIIPRSQSITSNNLCRIIWNYYVDIVDNGNGTYGAISYGYEKPLNNNAGNIAENTNIANLLVHLSSEISRIQTIIRVVKYRKCAILNILSINNKFL